VVDKVHVATDSRSDRLNSDLGPPPGTHAGPQPRFLAHNERSGPSPGQRAEVDEQWTCTR